MGPNSINRGGAEPQQSLNQLVSQSLGGGAEGKRWQTGEQETRRQAVGVTQVREHEGLVLDHIRGNGLEE